MKRPLNLAVILLVTSLLSSCAVVRQGEVGVKRTLGKIQPEPIMEGVKGYNSHHKSTNPNHEY